MAITRSQSKNISINKSHSLALFISISSTRYFLTTEDIRNCMILNKILFTGINTNLPFFLQEIAINFYNNKKRIKILSVIKELVIIFSDNKLSIIEQVELMKIMYDFILENIIFIKTSGLFLILSKVMINKLVEFRSQNHLMDTRFDLILD
jgi:hypothetical protein